MTDRLFPFFCLDVFLDDSIINRITPSVKTDGNELLSGFQYTLNYPIFKAIWKFK